MRFRYIELIGLLSALMANPALAQKIEQPEQFYSDGKKINGWSRQADGRRTTFWFAKYVDSDWEYRQNLVSIYDDEPRYAYYQDTKTRLFLGRLDLETDRYSLLPYSARKAQRSDIPESAFPPFGELPTVEALLRRENDGAGSHSRLFLVPATKEYPRFHHSEWESEYQSIGEKHRIKAKIVFNGDTGTYSIGDGQIGSFANVTYLGYGDAAFLISGNWTLAGVTGDFRFSVPRDNVNSFSGEWTLQTLPPSSGIWDGVRTQSGK